MVAVFLWLPVISRSMRLDERRICNCSLEQPSVYMDETLNYYAKFALHCELRDSMQQNTCELNALETAKRTLSQFGDSLEFERFLVFQEVSTWVLSL